MFVVPEVPDEPKLSVQPGAAVSTVPAVWEKQPLLPSPTASMRARRQRAGAVPVDRAGYVVAGRRLDGCREVAAVKRGVAGIVVRRTV